MTAPIAKPSTESLTDLLGADQLRRLVALAIEEDLGDGDLTSSTAVPPGSRVLAKLVAKGDGVLAGLELFREAFFLTHYRLDYAEARGLLERVLALDGPPWTPFYNYF